MNLAQINELWKEYKQKHNIDNSILLDEVRYDTPEHVEGYFDLLEMMDGRYIIHLNKRFFLYNDAYIRFVLYHEFTHFYDYISCPFEPKQQMFSFMNAYSEFHACQVTLKRCLESLVDFDHTKKLRRVDVDKIQIPGPFREVSVRQLLEMTIQQAKYLIAKFLDTYQLKDFINGFRVMMYLFGYLSLFDYDELLVKETLTYLNLTDERFFQIYEAMKKENFEDVVGLHKEIGDYAMLLYIRTSFRRYYSKEVLPDEELEEITLDNYSDYIKKLAQRMEEMGLDPDAETQASYLPPIQEQIVQDVRDIFRLIQPKQTFY